MGFIFPGQGNQFIGMGKSFFDDYTEAKEIFDVASDILQINMQNLLFKDNSDINLTKYTQPSVLLISYIAYKLFSKMNKELPVFALGHSLGEITANVASNSIKVDKSFELVYKRGELMQRACDGKDVGMAVIIGINDDRLEEFINSKDNIWYVNYNSNIQGVIAGYKSVLSSIESELKEIGAKRYLMLPISIASHCPILDAIEGDFKDILEDVLSDNFQFEIISNATTKPYNDKSKALELLTMQLTKPVLYKQSIVSHHNEVDCFIEFGGNILKGLNKRITDKPTYSITDTHSLENTLNEIYK